MGGDGVEIEITEHEVEDGDVPLAGEVLEDEVDGAGREDVVGGEEPTVFAGGEFDGFEDIAVDAAAFVTLEEGEAGEALLVVFDDLVGVVGGVAIDDDDFDLAVVLGDD